MAVIQVKRLGLLVTPQTHPMVGENINGPSLIEAPAWLPQRLGKYYLYFAHHLGERIRLAYADRLSGPWKLHVPGTLRLSQTRCHGHIASPDVHVDHSRREIRMYFHGPMGSRSQQLTSLAISRNGIDFDVSREGLGESYFRVFSHRQETFALCRQGGLYRARREECPFEAGPSPFLSGPRPRHLAVLVREKTLFVFYSRIGDAPERIMMSTLDLEAPWGQWRASRATTVLKPERRYEGADLPIRASREGIAWGRENQLRDPAVFEEGDSVYLLYATAGERGIALARLHLCSRP